MISQAWYDVVAKALTAALLSDENVKVPAIYRSIIPADLAPALGEQLGKIAVDTLVAYQEQEQGSGG